MDRHDPGMGMRAALDFAPQHSGHDHVGAEIGLPGHFVDPVRSDRAGADDLLKFLWHIRHSEAHSCWFVAPAEAGAQGKRSGRRRSGFLLFAGTTELKTYSAAARIGSASSKAARSRGGDIGRSRIRIPIASAIALATAAIGGMIGTSPQPRAPNGWRGFGTSIRTVSIIGMSEATGTR